MNIFDDMKLQGEPLPAVFRESAGVTIDKDEDQWRRLSGDSSRDLAPMTQSRMQKMAHWLWESNLLANRIIELPVAYLVAEGARLVVKDPENQKALDRFWRDPINDMDLKLPKKVRELGIFGEQCYPAFVNAGDGMVRIGYLDPSLIATVVMDPDNPEQPIGIVTVKDRQGRARRYRVIINGPEEVFTDRTRQIREDFADGEAFLFRINDLSSGSRGRSDLLAQADWVDAYDQFLFGELERHGALRSFFWDVTLKNATADQVKARAKEITAPRPASVRVHNDSEEWSAETPSLQSADTSEGAKLFRNHVLGGATLPTNWFGGTDDVNRAGGESMAEATFKVLSMRQRFVKHMLESIGRYVLLKASGKKEIDWADPKNAVEALMPELTARDTTKYAQALQQIVTGCALAIDKALLTSGTALKLIGAIAGRLGVEFDAEKELKDAQDELGKRREEDGFTEPPGTEGAAAEAAMREAEALIAGLRESGNALLEQMRSGAAGASRAEGGTQVTVHNDAERLVEAINAALMQNNERLERVLEILARPRPATEKTITTPDGREFKLTEKEKT